MRQGPHPRPLRRLVADRRLRIVVYHLHKARREKIDTPLDSVSANLSITDRILAPEADEADLSVPAVWIGTESGTLVYFAKLLNQR